MKIVDIKKRLVRHKPLIYLVLGLVKGTVNEPVTFGL